MAEIFSILCGLETISVWLLFIRRSVSFMKRLFLFYYLYWLTRTISWTIFLKSISNTKQFFHLFLRILANVKLFNFPLGRLSKIQPTMRSFLQKSQKTIKLRTTNFFSGNLNLNFRPMFVNLLVKCTLILPVK